MQDFIMLWNKLVWVSILQTEQGTQRDENRLTGKRESEQLSLGHAPIFEVFCVRAFLLDVAEGDCKMETL